MSDLLWFTTKEYSVWKYQYYASAMQKLVFYTEDNPIHGSVKNLHWWLYTLYCLCVEEKIIFSMSFNVSY